MNGPGMADGTGLKIASITASVDEGWMNVEEDTAGGLPSDDAFECFFEDRSE